MARVERYEVIAEHSDGGGVFLKLGEIVELDEITGRRRMAYGFVKPYVAPPAPPAAPSESREKDKK